VKIENQISKISQEPGVYLFHDAQDKVIYIGKAVNLKNRVRSYWNETTWKDRPKLSVLVPKISTIETIITKSEKEALILESNLVFKHQPKYNVLLKANNKQFPWLVITYDEDFPRLIPVREVDKFKSRNRGKESRNKFFGPYTNISAMYENLNLVNELFPLRRKKIPPFKNRPCLNYDLGKCLGPCQGLVSREEYQKMLDQIEMLLKGNYGDLKTILQKEMQRYSDNQEYEKAAKARDRIRALESFNEVQNVISEDSKLNQDIFAVLRDDNNEYSCAQIFKTREGRTINRETIELVSAIDDKKEEVFISAFEQYYARIPDEELPKEILVNCDSNLEILEEWLSERKGSKVKIYKPQRGDKLAQLRLAVRNGKIIIEKLKLEQMEDAAKNINIALENLKRELDIRSDVQRIECFDISHIQGSSTVASMVVFVDGMPAKDEYRKFKISRDQNNDFASMQETVRRAYEKRLDNPEVLPNLIIIDGGKGQLSAAMEVIKELGLDHIRTVGLAKKEEEIFFPDDKKPLILDRKSPELFLVQRIRNEAHRFAITYHRKLRGKKSLKSKLENIPGLGPKKQKLLVEQFKTLNKIKEASVEELASLRGFNMELAEKVKNSI
jgi:excinuclease ABC subunit C